MRIGVISDTHIPDEVSEIPREILKAFEKVDLILHAGDLVDPSVLEKLKKSGKEVKAVWGNMDPYELRKELPEKEIFKAGKYKIGLMHGYGPAGALIKLLAKIFKEDNVDAIVFGHSHSPVNEKKNGILFFNPGSATDRIFAPYNSYGIIEVNDTIEGKIIKI